MNLGVKGKATLAPIVGMAVNITHAKQDFLSDLYLVAVGRKTARIADDKKRHADDKKRRAPRCCFKNSLEPTMQVPIARKKVHFLKF